MHVRTDLPNRVYLDPFLVLLPKAAMNMPTVRLVKSDSLWNTVPSRCMDRMDSQLRKQGYEALSLTSPYSLTT
jgi:hypothetical protein